MQGITTARQLHSLRAHTRLGLIAVLILQLLLPPTVCVVATKTNSLFALGGPLCAELAGRPVPVSFDDLLAQYAVAEPEESEDEFRRCPACTTPLLIVDHGARARWQRPAVSPARADQAIRRDSPEFLTPHPRAPPSAQAMG